MFEQRGGGGGRGEDALFRFDGQLMQQPRITRLISAGAVLHEFEEVFGFLPDSRDKSFIEALPTSAGIGLRGATARGDRGRRDRSRT